MLNTLGVLREYSVDRYKDHEEQWICDFHWIDKDHYIITCCTFKQAHAFIQQKSIEMDLSFKMVQGKTNLFSICGWDDDAQRMFNTCCAYAQLIR
jgi:hypothetical protein